jgi:hypothetical protein
MSYLVFLRAVNDTAGFVRKFARERVIPEQSQIDLLRTNAESLDGLLKAIVIACADSMAALHIKATNAGVNQKTMPVGFLEMLQWASDALSPIISMIPGEKPEMRAIKAKLEKISQGFTRMRETFESQGGESAYEELALMVALSSYLAGHTDGAANSNN